MRLLSIDFVFVVFAFGRAGTSGGLIAAWRATPDECGGIIDLR